MTVQRRAVQYVTSSPYFLVGLLHFLIYLLLGIAMPFLPLWFLYRGLNPDQIGQLLAWINLGKIITNPIIAHIADITGRIRLIIVLLLVYAAIGYSLYAFTASPAATAAIAVLISLGWTSIYPLVDSYTLTICGRAPQSNSRPSFGQIRMWGSVGFGIATVSGGSVFTEGRIALLLPVTLALLVAATFIATMISIVTGSQTEPRSGYLRSPAIAALRDRTLMLIILSAALIQASNGFFYSFAAMYWSANGISVMMTGILWGVGILSEIAVFCFAASLLRLISPTKMLVACAALTTVRWLTLGFSSELAILFVAQLLQGFTIGGARSAFMELAATHAPANTISSVVALYTLLGGGVLMSASIAIATYAYVELGISGYIVMALISAMAIPLIMLPAGIRLLRNIGEPS